MAEKKETSKVVLERTYVDPLHRQTMKVPPFRKAEKAMKTLKEFITQHMKAADVKVGRHLNLKMWEHGIKNPPHKIKVVATKDDKGVVNVELEGVPKEIKVEKSDSKKPSKKADDKKVVDAEVKEIKEEKAAESKKIEKEEIKELKKEQAEHSPKHHEQKLPPKHKEQIIHPVAPKHQ